MENQINKEAMFEFALEQKMEWKKTKDEVYRIALETARRMIEVAGLFNEWREYCKNNEA